MQVQLIRNATMRIMYAGHVFLADPYFAPKHSRPSYAGISPNPLIDLPVTPDEIMQGIEMIIVSHLHSDHFDPAAQERLSKDLPLFCQPGDAASIREKGFHDVRPVEHEVIWQGIAIRRVRGSHGTSEGVLADMGEVSGFVFQAEGEPLVYWCGDTVWYEETVKTIQKWQPQVIITHSSGAVWGPEKELIVMDASQTLAACLAAPAAKVIAVHMEALDHGTVSRARLREAAYAAGVEGRLVVLEDGEHMEI